MKKVIDLYSEYHRRKWFPNNYPDPYGELIDFINESAIRDLFLQSKQTKNRALLRIAAELAALLPTLRFADLYRDFLQVYQTTLPPLGCRPEFCYFHLRRLPTNERSELWRNFLDWADRSRSKIIEWHKQRLQLEKNFHDLNAELEVSHGIKSDNKIRQMNDWLVSTREKFRLDFKTHSNAQTLPDILASFRLNQWDETFDWNDFPALAKSFFAQCQLEKRPSIRKSDIDDSVQFCFAISPPERIIVEYGSAAGPVDAMRFISELAKGSFYSHINPQLSSDLRFAEDPRIVHFWSAVYVLAFIRKTGLKLMVGERASDLSFHLEHARNFWYRYDVFLACYRDAAKMDLQSAEDYFAELWRKSFNFEIPGALFLYEFDRAAGSFARVDAMDAALLAEEQFRTQYGNAWFASSKCATRIRDYWWEGFSLTLADILQDLDIKF